MSGRIAFVYDVDLGAFRDRCNLEMVDLVPVDDYKDIALLSHLVGRHVLYTGSLVADALVNDFASALTRFVKVFPRDYRQVIEQHKLVQRQWELVNVIA